VPETPKNCLAIVGLVPIVASYTQGAYMTIRNLDALLEPLSVRAVDDSIAASLGASTPSLVV
jgi:hypothetical protein